MRLFACLYLYFIFIGLYFCLPYVLFGTHTGRDDEERRNIRETKHNKTQGERQLKQASKQLNKQNI